MITQVGLLVALSLSLPVNHGAAAQVRNLLDDFWLKSGVVDDRPGMLLRMDVDLTGDGVPELLLAQTQTIGSSGMPQWFIYQRTSDQHYKLLGTLPFPPDMFRVTSNPARLIVYQKEQGPLGSVTTYAVSDAGLQQLAEEQDVAVSDREPEFRAWRTEAALKVLTANLDDFDGVTTPQWTDRLSNAPVADVSSLEDLIIG